MRYLLMATFLLAMPMQNPGPSVTGALATTASGCSLPFTDSFTRANGGLGSNWTNPSTAPIEIVSDAATVPAYSSGKQAAFVTCNSFTSAQYIQGVPTGVSGTISYFGFSLQGSGSTYSYLQCRIAGTCTVSSSTGYLGAFTLTIASGSTVCAYITSGGVIYLKVNGSLDPYHYTSTVTTGSPGLYFYSQDANSIKMNSVQAGDGSC
jgi:hypothetical protein